MISLRARLRAVVGATLALCWICGVGMLVVYTTSSDDTLWDRKLQSFGTRLLMSLPAEKLNRGPYVPGLQLRPKLQREPENFAFQVWRADRKLFIKTPGAPDTPFQPSFEDGLASNVVGGRKWRIFTISDRDNMVSVQVANLQRVVDGEMYNDAMGALAVLTAVVLLLAVLLAYVLDRTLRPLDAVEDAVLRRADFDLTPLPAAAIPVEVQPLVNAFNHLLVQLDKAVAAERRFLSDAAHELRTPLSVLQVHTEVALHASSAAEKDEALHMLQQGVRRSARLAEQLLDLARVDAPGGNRCVEPLDLARLADHVVQEHAYHAQRLGCALDTATVPTLVEGDVDDLAILLRNLVDNAVRFAASGGHVMVTCGAADGWRYLCVADDGPGVPSHEYEAVFQRFYRLPGNNGRGSGIGLSLVAAIARLHGARIVTGSGLAGKGFAVRIEFPVPAGAGVPAAPEVRRRTGSPA